MAHGLWRFQSMVSRLQDSTAWQRGLGDRKWREKEELGV